MNQPLKFSKVIRVVVCICLEDGGAHFCLDFKNFVCIWMHFSVIQFYEKQTALFWLKSKINKVFMF